MQDFNFSLLKNEIGTQYNDMKGIAAIDGHMNDFLWRMCEDNGIDLHGWFLLGLEFSDGETIGEYPLTVSAYLVERASDHEPYEQVAERLGNTEKVEIHKKSFDITYQDLGKYIKRLNIGVLSDISSYIQDAVFIDD